MYSSEERDTHFESIIGKLRSANLIEGIIQLGSGVIGYKDEHSDIDLMVCTARVEDVEETKNLVYRNFRKLNPIYIKEKQLRENVFLLIVFMENSLEFNVSIVQTQLLSVKSPLWKIIIDKTGFVTEKMKLGNERFNHKLYKNAVPDDVLFEFFYCAMKLDKELQRKNLIYALKMLETMRDYTLQIQALNENKKLHQFKAFETLQPLFIKKYLSTFPEQITFENISGSAAKLIKLFTDTVGESDTYTINEELSRLWESVSFSN